MGEAFKEVMNLVIGIGAIFGVLIIAGISLAVGARLYDYFWPPKNPPSDGELSK